MYYINVPVRVHSKVHHSKMSFLCFVQTSRQTLSTPNFLKCCRVLYSKLEHLACQGPISHPARVAGGPNVRRSVASVPVQGNIAQQLLPCSSIRLQYPSGKCDGVSFIVRPPCTSYPLGQVVCRLSYVRTVQQFGLVWTYKNSCVLIMRTTSI